VAAGLCADRRIRLEEGSWWAFEPKTNTIFVPNQRERGLDDTATAGLVAHEVGHVWLSRYTAFPVEGLPTCAGRLLLNALEDGRVETWMLRRYPGVIAWLRAVPPDDGDLPETPFLQYVLTCAREGSQPPRTSAEAPPQPVLPQVEAALLATRAARERYRLEYLPTVTVRPPIDAYVRYDAEVAPLDEGDDPPTEAEAWVRVLAYRASRMAQSTLFTCAAALYDEEIATVAWALGSANLEGRARQPTTRAPFSVVRAAFLLRNNRDVDAWDEHRELARTIVDDAYALFAQATRAPRRVGFGPTDRSYAAEHAPADSRREARDERDADIPSWFHELTREARSRACSVVPYETLLASTVALRAQLRETLLPVFPPRRAPHLAFARRGRGISLRGAFLAEASQIAVDRVFLRRDPHVRPRLALSLLVDTSGSMQGPKLENALLAAVTIAESLLELGVPFGVNGFQDELLPVFRPGSGASWDDAARARLTDLQLEAAGRRPGGHNVPRYNDDGPCLLEAAAELLQVDADDRWLFMLTDGCPEGRHSLASHLERAVESLARPDSGVHVVGIGVGEDTEGVRAIYPRHLAEVPIDDLASELVALLERCVLVGG
jgi:hypothetical protein